MNKRVGCLLWDRKESAFTIVELLIVIVVIAILAAVTIVAYNGIQNRAQDAVVKNDVAQAVRQVEAVRASSNTETYPAASEVALRSSRGVTLTYNFNKTANSFCVSATSGAQQYVATSIDKAIRPGDCAISDGLVVWLPMNGDATNLGSAGGVFSVNNVTSAIGQNEQANGAYQFSTNSLINRNITTDFPQITAAAWVFNDTLAGTPGLIGGSGASAPSHWEIGSGLWRVRLGNIDNVGIVAAAPVQTWSHVAFTYDRSTGAFRYYLNGTLVRSSTPGDSGLNGYFVNGLNIGQSNGSSRQWLGRIDDVRVYNRVLSDAELGTMYAAGAQ